MAATWQRLGDAAGTKGDRRQPRAHRPRQAFDAAAFARRVGGDLLRPRRLGPRRGRTKLCARSRAGDCIVHLADQRGAHAARRARTGSTCSSSGRAIRPSTAGCRARARCGFGYAWIEGRDDDPWDVEAEVGDARVRRAAASGPRTSSRSTTSTLDEDGDKWLAEAAGSGHDRPELVAPRGRVAARDPALPLRGRGGVRRARRRRDARALAVAGQPSAARREARDARAPRRATSIARPPGTRIAHFDQGRRRAG